MSLLKYLGRWAITISLSLLLMFGAFKLGTGIGWTITQLKNAEKVNDQLTEVYDTQAYLLVKFVENIAEIEVRMENFQTAMVVDLLNLKKAIDNLEIKDEKQSKIVDENFELVNKNVEALLELLARVDTNSLGRDTQIVDVINEAHKKPTYDYLRAMTVYLVRPNPLLPGKGIAGTGVVVRIDNEYTYILTNEHVCSGAEDQGCVVLSEYEGAEDYELEPYKATSTDHDMAILRYKGQIPDKLAIRGVTHAEPQDEIYLVGHHMGRPFMYGQGVMAGYDQKDQVIQIPVFQGNSGSGVFNKHAQLVGLVWGGKGINAIQVDWAHGQVVPGAVLKMFLGDLVDE